MDAAGHLARSVQAGDDVAFGIQHMALGIHLNAAHGVVRGGSHQADAQRGVLQIVGIHVVAAVLVLFHVADGAGSDCLAHILKLALAHHGHVVVADGFEHHVGIGRHANLCKQVAQLGGLAGVVAAVEVAFFKLDRAGDGLGHVVDFNEYALGAVDFHAVLKLRQGQHVALGALVHEALARGGVDVHGVVAAAEGQVAVVHPGNRHQLGEAHARGGRADLHRHVNAAAGEG